ncbi:MAG: cell division protein FtsZ [Bacteriodetes bacterium]|nr:cell division protein FtsZ [Bacteroidota bacterium]
MPIELDCTPTSGAKIRVVGVGGGGGNAINSMIKRGLNGVDFIAANTDAQALQANLAGTKVQIGKDLTRGLGAGADPTIGELAVEESIEDVREALNQSDMIFVTAGMGGGTGTGGAPVIARIGRELNALVVGIVTKPFNWEARKRSHSAEHGISSLRKHVDALIVIPNQKLMNIIDKNTSFVQAFQKVDDVLYNATKGIADIISGNGYVNVDFADVRTIMKGMGDALMGIGIARGECRALEAAINAINSPLLEGVSIKGAKGVLVNITASSDVSMQEVGDAIATIEEAAGDDVNLIFGVVFNEELGDQLMVTVVATGFNKEAMEETTVDLQTEVLPHIQQQMQSHMQNAHVQQVEVVAQVQEQFVYQETKIAANGGGVVSTPQFIGAVQQQQQRSIPAAAPIGVGETTKYDAPAYARRNGSIPLNNTAAATVTTDNDLKDKSPIEKPAFLRKIMD